MASNAAFNQILSIYNYITSLPPLLLSRLVQLKRFLSYNCKHTVCHFGMHAEMTGTVVILGKTCILFEMCLHYNMLKHHFEQRWWKSYCDSCMRKSKIFSDVTVNLCKPENLMVWRGRLCNVKNVMQCHRWTT